VAGHDAVDDRETQPGPLLLRREKGIEDPGTVFLLDPDPRVANAHRHGVRIRVVIGPDRQGSPFFHGFAGVDEEVEEHLLHVRRVGLDLRQGVQDLHHLDIGDAQLVRDEGEGLLHHLDEVHGFAERIFRPREIEQVLHDGGRPLDLPAHRVEVPLVFRDILRPGLSLVDLPLHEPDVRVDAGQRVVDLVRHGRRQRAHGGELLRMKELRLGRL
jgi:hypothetical protein